LLETVRRTSCVVNFTTHDERRTTHEKGPLKIYTKTGDAGETGLLGGSRVSKDDPRVRAYGDVDELNATLGFAIALDPRGFEADVLQEIQRDLFGIGAELATPNAAKVRETVKAERVSALEQLIDTHEATLTPLKNFILPGGTPKAAALHIARTTCRRAERGVVTLARDEQINPIIIHYLNRLSDLLFVLARVVNKQAGQADIVW
jgi:cob(I)alamin adenosyltransferase